jgi:predicted  nucleic acid-binding Zn-ribbon protein
VSEARSHLRASRRPPSEASGHRSAPPPSGHAEAREERAAEIAALIHLAELDAALLDRGNGRQAPAHGAVADERHELGARLSPEVLEAYERALRAGRSPAVVRLVASVCSGCHMRLHSKLDHQIRQRRGVAPCPRCLRLVYDPAWLSA